MVDIKEILKIKISLSLESIDKEIDRYSKIETYNSNGNVNPLEEIYYEYMSFLNNLKQRLETAIELLENSNERI